MKRWLSALLLAVLLAQTLPCAALAAVGRVLTQEELDRAYALTGLGEGDGLYHNGMRPNASWNAAQLSGWLEDKLSLEVYNLGDILSRTGYALSDLEQRDPAGYKRYENGDVYKTLQSLYVEVEAQREEMRYYKKHLDECSGLIAEMRFALSDQAETLFDSEKVRKSARIEEAVAALIADRQYVVDHIDEWEQKAEKAQRYLKDGPVRGRDEEFHMGKEPYVGGYLSELFSDSGVVANDAPVTAVSAANTRLSRLSADAGLRANDVDAHITVITDQQICFSLVTEQDGKKTSVPGVSLTVRDILNPNDAGATYTTDPDGLLILPTNQFMVDKYDVIHVSLAVDGESKGYRSLSIDDLDMGLGDTYEATMIPLDAASNAGGREAAANAGRTPYIVSAELGKKDIMFSDYEMVYSMANDYDFEIKVEVRDAEGYPDLMMSWYENNGSFELLKQCWAEPTTHEGNVYTFRGPWKQKFSPNASKNQRPAFSFGKDGPKFTSRLVSVRSAVDKPLNEGTGAGGGVFAKILDSKNINLGVDIPLGDEHKIHIGLNLPFTQYLPKLNVDPGGYVVIFMGSDILGSLVEGAKVNWKSQDAKDFKRAQTYVEKKAGFANYKAQYDLAYEFYREKAWKFIGESTLKFGIYAVGTARWQLDNDDPDVKTKLVTARVGAGFTMTYTYSWTISYPVGAIPAYVCFTLGVSAGFAVDFDFNFCWINGEFQNFEFKPLKTLTINVMFFFSAQFGVGIKGFLEAYIKFSASLNFLIRISMLDEAPSSLTITYALSMSVGVTIFWIDFVYTWTFKKGQLWPNSNSANLLGHYMNAEADAEETEEAPHQEPVSYPDLQTELQGLDMDSVLNTRQDMKLVTAGKYTYVFCMTKIADKNGKQHSRVSWKRVGEGLSEDEAKLHSMQEIFESAPGDDIWDMFATRDDYDFDVRAADGFVFLIGLNAGAFDENSLPITHDKIALNVYQYAIALEPDANGCLTYKLSVHDDRDRNFWIPIQQIFGDRVVTNLSICYAGVRWDDYDSRKISFFEMSVKADYVRYDKDKGLINLGPCWFAKYNGLMSNLELMNDASIGNSMGDGYERVKVRTTLIGEKKSTTYDYLQHHCLPFVALSAPKDGGTGDRVIEYLDWDMNYHLDKNVGVKAVALAKGDIQDFEVVSTRVEDGTLNMVYYVEQETSRDGDHRYRLKGLRIDPIRGKQDTSIDGWGKTTPMQLDVTQYDYDVTLPADSFSVGYIGVTPYLYWWNASPKDDNADENVWRVWAMACDPVSNTMSDAFVLAQFETPKMLIEGEPTRSFDTMTGDWVVKPEKKLVDTVPSRVELTDSGTGHIVVTATEKAYGEDVGRTGFYNFDEQLLASADLQSAVPQDLAIKAGDFEDIDIGVMNTGNVALATFDVELREVDSQGNEGDLVETVHVNLVDPEKSKVTLANGNVVLSGAQAAHRAEDYDYSPRQRDFIHRQESLTYKMKVGAHFELEGSEMNADETRHLASNVLMPGSLGDFMAAFRIPENWKDKKNLRLRLSRFSVESNWLRRMANAAGIASNAAANDGSESVELVYALNRETGKLVLQKPAVSNATVDHAIASGLYANTVDGGEAVDIVVDIHDMAVDHRVYTGWDGRDWLDITVHDLAATGEALKLTCAVYVDGAEEPRYLDLPYFRQATSTRRTQTISLPVSALVDDPNAHRRARVVITAVDTEERAYANNEFTVYLDGADPLRFTKQPEDATVQEGEDVSFSVEVAGGVKPYSYQWQVWDPVHKKWVDLPGFTEPTLFRKDIEKKWDGAKFRCVVTDAEGTQIVSREVTLTVRDRVPTGDDSNLPLYLAVALIALALLWQLRRRARRA